VVRYVSEVFVLACNARFEIALVEEAVTAAATVVVVVVVVVGAGYSGCHASGIS
jgi:hypothetical protein